MINLGLLEKPAGEEGARGLFPKLILRLASLKYDDPRTIQPAQGDWGIDVITGSLTSGSCIVWQAKYFPKSPNRNQQRNIEESFNTLNKKRIEEKFNVDLWILCVPCAFTPTCTRWWENWAKQKMDETGIKIQLWHKDYLETQLVTPEARNIVEYFSIDGGTIPAMVNEKTIIPLPDDKTTQYDSALFIKKLIHAKITETSSARAQFFNAELVQKEIIAREDTAELDELNGTYEKILEKWENLFNKAIQSTDPLTETKNVYFRMNDLISELDKSYLNCPKMAVIGFHKKGFMHQLSDKCKLGWSPAYKTLAEDN
jgi:hypothetical protein